MIPDRYSANHARAMFSDEAKILRWWQVTRDYALAAVERAPLVDAAAITKEYEDLSPPSHAAVVTREHMTGHDVVAFLSLIEQDLSPQAARFLHYGLTSSDIVDNAHFETLRVHAALLAGELRVLRKQIIHKTVEAEYPRAGRTHGQIADVTSLDHQFEFHEEVLLQIENSLNEYAEANIIKSPGPTGNSPLRGFDAHNLAVHQDAGIVSSTQVIHRDHQLRWAVIYMRLACALENLALLVRAGSHSGVGELGEGDVMRRVGSSSIPHKRNPIDSEKVCGLARVARGYVASIAEGVALWDDRDLSNSSLERIVVPDLAATVEHMTVVMAHVIENLAINAGKMLNTASQDRTMSNLLQSGLQKHFNIGPVQAGRLMREYIDFSRTFYIDTVGLCKELDATGDQLAAWHNEAKHVWEGQLNLG